MERGVNLKAHETQSPFVPPWYGRRAKRASATTALLLIALAWTGCRQRPAGPLFPALRATALQAAVAAAYAPTRTLPGAAARDALYRYEQDAFGAVRCLYSGYGIPLPPGQDPSAAAFARGINAEHVWPRSWGAGTPPAVNDLHILFPAREDVNAARSNHPFAEIPDADVVAWYGGAATQPEPPPPDRRDAWSERALGHPDPAYRGRFEPREARAGDVARALFYFAAVYRDRLEPHEWAFFTAQLPDLLAWHRQDPADAAERARSAWVRRVQGAPNPFVLDTSLARRAFARGS